MRWLPEGASSAFSASSASFKFLNMSPKAVRDWLITLRDPLIQLLDDFGCAFMNLESAAVEAPVGAKTSEPLPSLLRARLRPGSALNSFPSSDFVALGGARL